MPAITHPQMVRKAAERLPRLLERPHGVRVREKEGPCSMQGGPHADLVLKIGASTFVVECKTVASTATIAAAIHQIRSCAARLGAKAIPVIVAPYMGEAGARLCEEAGIGWFDLSDNAHLEGPGVRIHIEGKPNAFKQTGRPASVFAPKSARVARWFLMHPGEGLPLKEIVLATGLDKGFASRILRRMEEQDLVIRAPDGVFRLRSFDTMLEAWREAYDFSRHQIVRGHFPARSGEEAVRLVADALGRGEIQHAVTGLGAAWLMTHFAAFRLVTLYVSDLPDEELRRKIGFHEEERGENLWLVVPNDEGVFQGMSEREGVPCVHPVQAWLDLKGHPERAAEAADSLRRQLMEKSSHA
ncbi:MAG: hypothetical protein NTX84_08850 [Nitrospirae bacterium]|nr:hypothetical protein [Nitrospirota bacterium]